MDPSITVIVRTGAPAARRVEAWRRDGAGALVPAEFPPLSSLAGRAFVAAVHRLAARLAADSGGGVDVVVDGKPPVRHGAPAGGGARAPAAPPPKPKARLVVDARPSKAGAVKVWDVALRGTKGEPLGLERCLRGGRGSVVEEARSLARGLVEGGSYRAVSVVVDGTEDVAYEAGGSGS